MNRWLSRSLWRLGASAIGVSLLSGCASMQDPASAFTRLPEPVLPDTERQMLAEAPERVAQRYKRALQVAQEPALRQTVRRRLADLAMARSERELAESESTDALFDEPIERYQALLSDFREGRWIGDTAEVDKLYYQLSKAYALDGRMAEADLALEELATRYPQSRYFPEAQFRRAERAFSMGDYSQAEALYAQLVPEAQRPDGAGFAQNALYMRAWTQFKRGDYQGALVSFTGVLDYLLESAQARETDTEAPWASLGSAQTEVAGDALRAMALALAYLEGPPSILALERQIGPRAYQHRLYRRLAETYLEQERYRDSARTYAQFVAQNPDSDRAPGFSVSEIEVYRLGRYPSRILPAKQAFVRRYGLLSRYWYQRGGEPGDLVLTQLHEYLHDLANYQHARAQRLQGAERPQAEQRQAFAHAATWYREFVASFPDDAEAARMEFLLAETLHEAEQWPEALDHYERVAFVRQDGEHGREAGYAAVLLAGQLAAVAGEGNSVWWQRRLHIGQSFAQQYPEDPRATGVLSHLARGQLARGELGSAEALAEQLLNWQPPAAREEVFSAWLVLGHSRFDRANYVGAGQAYWQVLAHWPETDASLPHAMATNDTGTTRPTRMEVRERIAASLYQRARQQLDLDQVAEAVTLLQQIPDELPNTTVAIRAQYDVAHYLAELQRWPEAQSALLRFRRDYPEDPLSAQLPARLAAVYQAQENWRAAAAELRELERTSDDPELQRESLYLAAELYERADDPAQALEAYRDYANSYPTPAADRREAEYQLSELYRHSGDVERRAFWLQRLVDGHSPESGRSTYLAAFATSELAEASFAEFSRIELRLPLKPSLDRKRAALEHALADQEAVLDYGVAEFTTRASHRMAAIYHQLSRDLMASERPEGLGVLELEQYDILLEEQAYPFEERAVELYEINARRSQSGVYDDWVKNSFEALADILPARFGKREQVPEISRDIH